MFKNSFFSVNNIQIYRFAVAYFKQQYLNISLHDSKITKII